MEPVVAQAVGPFHSAARAAGLPAGKVPGVVEKALREGHYWARLEGGQRVEVHSARPLRAGQEVTVIIPGPRARAAAPVEPSPSQTAGRVLAACLPFEWEEAGGEMRLEVFTEKVRRPTAAPGKRPLYFLLTTDFEDGDQLQWSLYLKDKNVSIQLYAGEGAGKRHDLDRMAGELAGRLRKQGFHLTSPVTRLKKPFRVPEGFGLNVRA